ncbi:MAG: segregation/condensation protein A, partial [Polymorphum sp.]|nr:segregation/condensation protein A [Polymorphum sp.]
MVTQPDFLEGPPIDNERAVSDPQLVVDVDGFEG